MAGPAYNGQVRMLVSGWRLGSGGMRSSRNRPRHCSSTRGFLRGPAQGGPYGAEGVPALVFSGSTRPQNDLAAFP